MNKTVSPAAQNDPLTIKKMPMSECAPDIQSSVCSDKANLDALREWLKTNVTNPKEIIAMAKKKTGCDSESCLYKKIDVLDEDVLETRFIPAGPRNNTNWLSNVDIDTVLDQYAKKFTDFLHVNFGMRDFESTGGPLANVDWADAAKRYKSLGCALNTDTSSGPGEHWTAFYVDFVNGTVEYFDSAAQTPLDEFSEFAIRTADKLSKVTGRKFSDVVVNKIIHQTGNTECGVYTLYYIISRLHGVKYTAFQKARVDDDLMVMMRASLFRA